MVDVAQLVEHQIVALGVMGSNPIIHPIFLLSILKHKNLMISEEPNDIRYFLGNNFDYGWFINCA